MTTNDDHGQSHSADGSPSPDHGHDSGSLQPLTVALLECVTPADVATVVVDRGMAVLGARAGLVALLSEDGLSLEVIEAHGYNPRVMQEWGRFPINASLPLSDVTREGVPLFITSRAEWQARYPDMTRWAIDTPQAAAGLPLIARRCTIGGLHFSFADEREFTEVDRAFALELSRQCALALERAQSLAQAEEGQLRLRFLARASETFSASLDYQTTLSSVARMVVPDFADWCAVDTVAEDGSLERLAVAHVDPAKVEWARELQKRYPPDPEAKTGVFQVLRSGQPEFYPDIPDAMLDAAARDPEERAIWRQIGFRSVVVAPLIARGRTLGAISFVTSDESGRRFRPSDLAFAEDLARRAAVAVDNARLYLDARRSEQALRDNEARQGAFLRDVLGSVTEGRLCLCHSPEDLPDPPASDSREIGLSVAAIPIVRHAAREAAVAQGFSPERTSDLETAVSEAVTNAVRHAGGGAARVSGAEGRVQVRIEDQGQGIDMQRLPRATLERGFTTAGTLGHGFWFMLRSVDQIWLLTGSEGTTLVLEQNATAPRPSLFGEP